MVKLLSATPAISAGPQHRPTAIQTKHTPASTFLMPLASWMVTLMTPSGGSYRAQNMFRAAVSVDNWTGMRLGSTSNCCSCVFTTC